jgi:hypothetical protein
MTKLFKNVKFFLIWGINEIYSLKDLRLDTPISLPTMVIILISWFIILTYMLVL